MLTSCPRCGAAQELTDRFCSACGADPQVELEIAAFHGPALETARKWILAIGIIYVASALLVTGVSGVGFDLDDPMVRLLWGTSLGLCAIHLGLWVWAKTAPFPAAVVALVLFVTVQAINAVVEPSSMYKGLLIKVLFLVALIRAVKAGSEAQRLRAQRS